MAGEGSKRKRDKSKIQQGFAYLILSRFRTSISRKFKFIKYKPCPFLVKWKFTGWFNIIFRIEKKKDAARLKDLNDQNDKLAEGKL